MRGAARLSDASLSGRNVEDTWPAVVCLGEALIDFVSLEPGQPIERVTTFHRAAGGAPANVAVALSRLGVPVGFIGKLGDDAFGSFLRQTLADEGVDLRGLVDAPDARTPLAFVSADGEAGRRFVFYHTGMADTLLRADELDHELIRHASIFHFGSVSLAAEPSRTATLAAARLAREHGCLVSFDPNVRLELWDAPSRALACIAEGLHEADVVKVSADELEFLTGTPEPGQACRCLREYGPSVAVVTLGSRGCYYDIGTAASEVPAPRVEVVDTLGAGDAFMAGLLAGIVTNPDHATICDRQVLVSVLRFANAAGALTTAQHGAIPALPTRAQVDALVQNSSV